MTMMQSRPEPDSRRCHNIHGYSWTRPLLAIITPVLLLGETLALALESIIRVPVMDRHTFLATLAHMGGTILPMTLLISFFGGVLMALQTEPIIMATGAASTFGWGVGYTYLREIGPLLVGLVFIGGAVLRWAGDLAMTTGDKTLRAMALYGVDPITLAIAPRFWAGVIALPLLVAIGDIAAMAGAALYGELVAGVGHACFVSSLLDLDMSDVSMGLVKGTLFGATGALSAALSGLRAQQGEKDAASTVSRAALGALAFMMLMDFLVTKWW